jgi:hypothetical protein
LQALKIKVFAKKKEFGDERIAFKGPENFSGLFLQKTE